MIASLKGEILHKSAARVIVNVNGVGYQVHVSLASYERLPAAGRDIFLHIYTDVREDAIKLYGFHDAEEKEMFQQLITVSGVGPKLALGILSGIGPAELAGAISTRDIGRLTELSGVGKKTAERLCLDLKDKALLLRLAEGEPTGAAAVDDRSVGRVNKDVISALMNLGYPQVKARQALEIVRKRLPAAESVGMQVEELLRETLRTLA